MAKSISVALADMEPMASGCSSRVSSPSSPVTVTGNAGSSAADDESPPSSSAAGPPPPAGGATAPPQAESAKATGRSRVAARDRRERNCNTGSLREGGGEDAHERTQRSM